MKRSLRFLSVLFALSSVPAALMACSGDESEESQDAEGAVRASRTGSLYDKLQTKLPPEAPRGRSYNSLTADQVPSVVAAAVPLEVDRVVAAMQKIKAAFYPERGAAQYSSPAGYTPDNSEPSQCFEVCPVYYSDIVCQFYCGLPGYKDGVSDNVRACFSLIARNKLSIDDNDGNLFRFPTYSTIYAYCLYGEGRDDKGLCGFDFGLDKHRKLPRWDESKALANKLANKKRGVLKWVDDNIKDDFQYVMYTWYNPFAFTIKSQQKAINEFYGVKVQKHDYTAQDRADVKACKQSRRRPTPSDPQDGTHCSSAKAIMPNGDSLALHEDYDNIVKAMRKLHPQ
jgi:hypothetical protein